MSAWRPEGWKKNKDDWFRHSAHSKLADGSVFEAGADAMLEAVTEEIEKGLLTDEEMCTVWEEWLTIPNTQEYQLAAMTAQAQLQKTLALLRSK